MFILRILYFGGTTTCSLCTLCRVERESLSSCSSSLLKMLYDCGIFRSYSPVSSFMRGSRLFCQRGSFVCLLISEDPDTTKIGSSSACQRNIECWLGSFVIFQGIRTRGGGGGGTPIFSYIRRLGSFLGVQNFEFQFFFIYLFFFLFWGWGGVQKNKYFLGYEDFVDIYWGHHKIGLYLGVISMHFRVFS